jgi:hypothetical protein
VLWSAQCIRVLRYRDGAQYGLIGVEIIVAWVLFGSAICHMLGRGVGVMPILKLWVVVV